MASKAKKIHSISVTGQFDLGTMEIVELSKEEEFLYDFKSILEEFDGKNITVTIREQDELPTKE